MVQAETTVFAAASLKTALDEVAADFEDQTDQTTAISYAGTSVLARQISLGAPADIFIAASPDWMDWLEERGAISPDSRFDLLGNQLVLIAHVDQAAAFDMNASSLLATLEGNRIAMALVDAVPAGIYGKTALDSFGVWDALQDQVAQTDNVRAALALVARGEAPFGIVYETDALAEPRVSILARFPSGSHEKIRYPVALVAGPSSDATTRFITHLRQQRSRAIFEKHGFDVLVPPS
ncbi:MAG: molybdate ABC transporter substrate-binding protein [Paracoccaceae bacterium]|nr:molybdate ABC transporter substrate-binding protein [Paracoccaceae bacterium]